MSSGKVNNTLFFFRLGSWSQFLLIVGLSLLLYLPILGNSFVNDDFIVLKRLGPDGQFWVTGFFRPLSDLTLWLTYQLAGLRAWCYYCTGIMGHAIAVFLLVRLCVSWTWTANERQQQAFALLAGALFLTYPFHNESVAWILGRGALMANTLGILALWILVRPGGQVIKMATVSACYFVALAAYESVAVLPAMILLYLVAARQSRRLIATWLLVLGGSLALHLLLRKLLSGSFAGHYGDGFLEGHFIQYLLNYGKALARTLLPPMHDEWMMVIAFVALVIVGLVIVLALYKGWRTGKPGRRFFLILAGCFLISLLVPSVGAVSTHTSESDRLLHFPSFFVAMILAYVLVTIPGHWRMGCYVAALLLLVQVYWLEENNLRWQRASAAVQYVLSKAKAADKDHPLYIINLPEQIDGAYVFRVGFPEALQLNGIPADHISLARLPGGMPAGIPTEATVITWEQGGWKSIR